MSRRRKAIVSLAAVAMIAVGAWWLWPRNVYTYQGKTVEEWFAAVIKSPPNSSMRTDARLAFAAMGTNAAPFLASRITRNVAPSWLERFTQKLPESCRPMSKALEAEWAAYYLRRTKSPPPMIFNLVKSAYQSTNRLQQSAAHSAMTSQDR